MAESTGRAMTARAMSVATCSRVCSVAAVLLPGALAAQATWTQLATPSSPAARSNHACAFDIARGVVVMFGGDLSTGRSQETWEFDGAQWTLRSPNNSPEARCCHAMAYDFVRSRTVLFGGATPTRADSDDTWEWDGVDWVRAPFVAGPAPRLGLAMAFDFGLGRVVLFGGRTAGLQSFADLWEWNGASWSLIAASGPPGRCCHDLAYHLPTGSLLVFGGWDTRQGNFGDTWRFDGVAWSQLAGPAPTARWGHRMAFDWNQGDVVLHGGSRDSGETWHWDGAAWSLRSTTPTLERNNSSLVWDWMGQRVLMIGGVGLAGTDVWSYGPPLATYATFGSGCAGSLGTPALGAGAGQRPSTGASFTLLASNVPGFAALLFGTSTAAWGALSLPASLQVVGMPGCDLLVRPDATTTFVASGGIAQVPVAIPNQPALIGLAFHNQLFASDPPANAAGITASNGGSGVVGR